MTPLKLPFKEIKDSNLKVFFTDKIHSLQNDHRTKLRKALSLEIKKENPQTDESSLLDLKTLPTTPGFNVNLSHCRKACLLGYCSDQYIIGLDIECVERINPKIIKRFTHEQERQICPEIKMLFPAKEAAWKALNHKANIPTISHIETTNWTIIENNWYQFQVQLDGKLMDGNGFIQEFSDTYIAIFTTASTFDQKLRHNK